MILIHKKELSGFYLLGLNMTYHQIPMHKSGKEKTAFAILMMIFLSTAVMSSSFTVLLVLDQLRKPL